MESIIKCQQKHALPGHHMGRHESPSRCLVFLVALLTIYMSKESASGSKVQSFGPCNGSVLISKICERSTKSKYRSKVSSHCAKIVH